jgi:hypothetical protein
VATSSAAIGNSVDSSSIDFSNQITTSEFSMNPEDGKGKGNSRHVEDHIVSSRIGAIHQSQTMTFGNFIHIASPSESIVETVSDVRHLDNLPDDAATPTSSTTFPNLVAMTPKRAVKLATASSAAADWFSKGLTHLGIVKKESNDSEIVASTSEVAPADDSPNILVPTPERSDIAVVATETAQSDEKQDEFVIVDPLPQTEIAEVIEIGM